MTRGVRRRRAAAALGLLAGAWLAVGAAFPGTVRAQPAPALDRLAAGVTLYVPFDGDAAPRVATGARAVHAEGATFGPGKAGQAATVTGAAIAVPRAANFGYPRGTLAFWHRPSYDPSVPVTPGRPLFETSTFVVRYDQARRLVFMTGTTRTEEGFRWDYETAAPVPWRSGEWHHVAVTWDAATGRKVLYVDGREVGAHATPWMVAAEPPVDASELRLGSPQAPGAYDELLIWGRALAPAEVALLAGRPAEVAATLRARLPRLTPAPAWPITFDLHTFEWDRAREAIVEPGQSLTIHLRARNPGRAAVAATVTLVLLDFWEREREVRPIEVAVPAGATTEIAVPVRAPERGVFKLAVRLAHGGKLLERDVASFAAWPTPRRPPDPTSFFGHHVNSFRPGLLDQAARLGLAWTRNHNMLVATWWPRVEPERHGWTQEYDYQLDWNVRRGMRVLGGLFGTPYWAAAAAPLPRPTVRDAYPYPARPDLHAFAAYVRTVVTRYRDRVRHWEIGNEPDVSLFFDGTPEQFADVCRVGYRAIKAADPRATVLHGGYTKSSWQWHERLAAAGGFRHADALSAHFYYEAGAPAERLLEDFGRFIDHLRGLWRRFGPRRPFRLWNTEGGSVDSTFLRGLDSPNLPAPAVRGALDWRAAALNAVKSEVILQSLGVERSFAYLWGPTRGPRHVDDNWLDATNAPKPKLLARVALAAQLDGARYAGTVRHAGLWAAVYAKPHGQGTVVVWWASGPARLRVAVPWPGAVRRHVDVMGNERATPREPEVTDEPAYVHVAAPAARVLAALRRAEVSAVGAAPP